ncbi:46323_t:CDS:2, partial [Gigaspora margarita]
GSIPEREPEKRLPHPRKAAGAQITQSRYGEEQLEGKSGASSRGNSSSNSDGGPVLLVSESPLTSAKAFAKDVFINQERKLGDRRRSDTVVVLTINYAD